MTLRQNLILPTMERALVLLRHRFQKVTSGKSNHQPSEMATGTRVSPLPGEFHPQTSREVPSMNLHRRWTRTSLHSFQPLRATGLKGSPAMIHFRQSHQQSNSSTAVNTFAR